MKQFTIIGRTWKFLNDSAPSLNAVASILLGAMALIVSVKSCEVAEHQTRLAEIEYLPQFRVLNDSDYDVDTRSFVNHRLLVFNDGAGISNVDVSYKSFFVLTGTESASGESTKAILEVLGYFNMSGRSGESVGRIYTIYPSERDVKVKAIMLEYDLSENTDLLKLYDFIDVELVHLVAISYTNRMNDTLIEYFIVDPVAGGRAISSEEFISYNDQRPKEMWSMIKFSDATVDRLVKEFGKIRR